MYRKLYYLDLKYFKLHDFFLFSSPLAITSSLSIFSSCPESPPFPKMNFDGCNLFIFVCVNEQCKHSLSSYFYVNVISLHEDEHKNTWGAMHFNSLHRRHCKKSSQYFRFCWKFDVSLSIQVKLAGQHHHGQQYSNV